MFGKVAGFVMMLCAFLLITIGLVRVPATYAASFILYADSSGISISGDGPLFDLSNMAPGDSASAAFRVENRRDTSIVLKISAETEGEGTDPFYQSLWVEVAD